MRRWTGSRRYRLWLFTAGLLAPGLAGALAPPARSRRIVSPAGAVAARRAEGSGPTREAGLAESLRRMPLYFIENRGQLDPRVSYYVQGKTTAVYFTSAGLTYALTEPVDHPRPDTRAARARLARTGGEAVIKASLHAREGEPARAAVALDFVGARPGTKPEAQDQTDAVVSYFTGRRERWQAGLRTYASVVYRDVWPGIDVAVTGTAGQMESTFVVKPGADPRRIRLRYRGASSVTIDPSSGALDVTTSAGGFRDSAPVTYQEGTDGRREPVTSAYVTRKDGGDVVASFTLGRYDRTRTLVIDPVMLAYCGYVGGGSRDLGWGGIAVDAAGNAYFAGQTLSDEGSFPVAVGPDVTQNGNSDAFVVKVRADGSGLVYAGFIGGMGEDYANGLAIDAAGNVFVTGGTTSDETTFPVSIGPDLTYNGGPGRIDAFVAKVRADGTGLVYCGYIGGVGDDEGRGIALDGAGNATLTGYTLSSEATFPVAIGPDLTYNGLTPTATDVFVARVRADGTRLDYAGYVGGGEDEYGQGLGLDAAGNAYVTGATNSSESTFPVVVGPDLTHNGGGPTVHFDAFVSAVRADGSGLVYSGYLGGDGSQDFAYGIAVNAAGNAYLTGKTDSTEATFPVVGGPDLTFNGGAPGDLDAFVTQVRPGGTGLVYSGYVGGNFRDEGHGIALDGAGNAYVTGITASRQFTFPVTGGPDLSYGGGAEDAFVAKLRADGSELIYAGYISGDASDEGYGIAVDAAGAAYVGGLTESAEDQFPVTGGPGLTFSGQVDGFVAKVTVCFLADLIPPPTLLAVKSADRLGADFVWGQDPVAWQYHVNSVTSRTDLRETNPTSPRRRPLGAGQTECVSAPPAVGCDDPNAIVDTRSNLLYYRVLSACGPLAIDEGPVCTLAVPCP